MAKRYGVTGLENVTSETQAKTFRTELEGQGWKFIAAAEPGYTIFEVPDSVSNAQAREAFSDESAVVIGVPVDYPR
ncbi:hypothetical protein AB0N05_12600 [Nocardia sp. NPDC051030]|uniref:hypothetical protein n=1 Tax=Nocardia sp. NPDC051030 TaxID=3155162 RepID=UPI00343E736C